ncbi:MAG: dTDP-glucose 4,6-dehydratase [Candidatus Altimarinota bacterium]
MQTILVTGGAGFIGSHFLNTFVSRESHIRFLNVDSLTYASDQNRIQTSVKNAPNYSFEHVDISEGESLENIYKKHQPTDVIHFAGETHVDRSIIDPDIFIRSNIVGTKNLLECHRKYSKGRFHYVSTDEVYGDISEGNFSKETDVLSPSSPYSASKAAAEMLVMAYSRTYKVDSTISRGSNTYGVGQYPEKLIPLSLKKLSLGKKISLYGDGLNVRDWLSVDDHVGAIWEIFTRGKNSEIYNIGASNPLTNKEIIELLLELLGKDTSWIEHTTDRPGHDRRYALDTTKIEHMLDWKPISDFQAEIKKIIATFPGLQK